MNIKQIAYRKYQLDWMIAHDHTLDELIHCLAQYMEDSDEPLVETYTIWEYERGFGGEIWACFDEFLEYCYRDKTYMRAPLKSDEYEEYLNDI